MARTVGSRFIIIFILVITVSTYTRNGLETSALLFDDEELGFSSKDLKCHRSPCTKHTPCCSGFACVEYVDNYGDIAGRCLPEIGRDDGEECVTDDECNEGLQCLYSTHPSPGFTCQHEVVNSLGIRKKLFADECTSSNDCDSDKKLCCQLQKRHRMAPRRLCLYYDHPSQCVGHVTDTNRIIGPPPVEPDSRASSWYRDEPYSYKTYDAYKPAYYGIYRGRRFNF